MVKEQFTGVWIPKEIWFDKKLGFMQRCLLAELYHLQDPEKDGFAHASNAYLSEFFGVSPRWISENISNLESQKYIRCHMNGKQRYVKVLFYGGTNIPAMVEQSFHVSWNNRSTIDNRESIKRKNPDFRRVFSFFLSEYERKTGSKVTATGALGKNVSRFLKVVPADEIIRRIQEYFRNGHWFTKDGYSVQSFVRNFDALAETNHKEKGPVYRCPKCGKEPTGKFAGNIPYCVSCRLACKKVEHDEEEYAGG